MTELTAWTKPTGLLVVDIETRMGETKLTMTVTTESGEIHYITTSATAPELRELAHRLWEAAERTLS